MIRGLVALFALVMATWCTLGAAVNLPVSSWWVLPLGWLLIVWVVLAGTGMLPRGPHRHHCQRRWWR